MKHQITRVADFWVNLCFKETRVKGKSSVRYY